MGSGEHEAEDSSGEGRGIVLFYIPRHSSSESLMLDSSRTSGPYPGSTQWREGCGGYLLRLRFTDGVPAEGRGRVLRRRDRGAIHGLGRMGLCQSGIAFEAVSAR